MKNRLMLTSTAVARKVAAAAGAAVVLTVLAGCATAPDPAAGPLQIGGEPSAVCVQAPAGTTALFGEVIENPTDSVLILSSVLAGHADNVTVVEAGIQAGSGDFIGAGRLRDLDELEAGWRDRSSPMGYRLEPGQTVNVLLAVQAKPSKRAGTIQSTVVTYQDAGGKTTFVARGDTIFTVTADSCR